MKRINGIIILLALVLTVMMTACKSSRSLEKPTAVAGKTKTPASSDTYLKKVVTNAQTAQAITAKVKVRLQMDEKDISLGGSLKMMRGDVIQLSLTFLGMEVGRMEFTQDQVLVVDRIHTQYVRVPYSKVSFLQSANLDFYSLQALFWNELFVPGTQNVTDALGKFTVASSGDHTLLSLTSAPRLDYAFLTVTQTGLLDRTTVSSKVVTDKSNLVCRYGDFTRFNNHSFPQSIMLAFTGAKNITLDLSLSSLNNNTDWTKRTELSSRYKMMNIDEVLKKLLPN